MGPFNSLIDFTFCSRLTQLFCFVLKYLPNGTEVKPLDLICLCQSADHLIRRKEFYLFNKISENI